MQQEKQQQQDKPPPKLKYVPPTIDRLGNVRERTKGLAGSGGPEFEGVSGLG